MAADYETVAATFKASDPVVIAEVNADNHKDLASRFGVRGFVGRSIAHLSVLHALEAFCAVMYAVQYKRYPCCARCTPSAR